MPNSDATKLLTPTRDIFASWRVPPDDAAWIATLLVRANGVPVDDETGRQIVAVEGEVALGAEPTLQRLENRQAGRASA